MEKVLVLDCDTQAALSVIRSLGKRGCHVTAAGSGGLSLGSASKYSDDRFVHPDPAEGCDTFVDALAAHLDENDYGVAFPVADETTTVLARHKRRLEETGTTVATEDWETFRKAYDKANTFSLVEDIEVPAPRTVAPESVADLERTCDDLRYPVVVKSRSKSVWDDDGGLHVFRVFPGDYVHSGADLVDRYRTLLASDSVLESYPPIVQEVVDGETTTTTLLADEGDVRAYFQERRLRTFPDVGGNSTLLGGIRDTRMLEYASRLVGELEWTGPAQVEFMRTADGEYYLIEMNGRYWGSLPFAIASGVDFPWLHFKMVNGLPCEHPATYRTDVTQRRLLFGDIKWLLEQLSDGNRQAVGPFVRDFFTTNHTFVSLEDPKPTALALVNLAKLTLSALGGEDKLPHTQW